MEISLGVCEMLYRKEWRLLLNEHGGRSRAAEATPNYGEGWSGNYELRQFRGGKKGSDGGGPHSGWPARNAEKIRATFGERRQGRSW